VRTSAARTVVGIDEAGRGSWIGPLVVGAVAVAENDVDRLADAGAADSKQLSPARREEVYARLGPIARCASVALEPAEIDRYVAHRGLNTLEARAFAEVCRPFGPAVVRADACDVNPARFARTIARMAGAGFRVSASHHADALDPLVGAASIVAKVRRDRAIRALEQELGVPIGSGYPSDPTTVAFVRSWVRRGEPLPPWLRSSWATTRRVIGTPVSRTLDGGSG
jgi:ribonuclease HII